MGQSFYKKGDYVDASRMWYVQPKITSNARILVSRNKREGYYAGRVPGYYAGRVPGYRARNERVARIYSLRGPKREKVDFADLGIRLHHPLET